MTHQARRASIGVESLEGRAVLSTVHAMVLPVSTARQHGLSYLDLEGSAQGSPSTVVGNPDVGTTVDLRGAAQIQGLGSVKVSGMLHGTGFIASSHVEGPLKLTDGKGSVTLQLQSPAKGGFTAPSSGTYTFSIEQGTGAFAHHIGNGTVALILKSSSFTIDFQGRLTCTDPSIRGAKRSDIMRPDGRSGIIGRRCPNPTPPASVWWETTRRRTTLAPDDHDDRSRCDGPRSPASEAPGPAPRARAWVRQGPRLLPGSRPRSLLGGAGDRGRRRRPGPGIAAMKGTSPTVRMSPGAC